MKTLKHLPKMPGITKETAHHLKWKSLKYLLSQDENRVLPRYFFKKPFTYLFRFIASILRKKSYVRQGDLFLYGVKSVADFEKLLQERETLLILGFSYCHKPFECPSGRFTDKCIRDPTHPICQQCFIGKALHTSKEKAVPLLIPTIHYIGEKMFALSEEYKHKKLLFMITACELTLEMFGDWGNMVHVPGIGVRLDGRICNTMRAFELSEKGIKPGLTVVLEPTQKQMLDLIDLYISKSH